MVELVDQVEVELEVQGHLPEPLEVQILEEAAGVPELQVHLVLAI